MEQFTAMFADALSPIFNLLFQFISQVMGFVLTSEFAAQVAGEITTTLGT